MSGISISTVVPPAKGKKRKEKDPSKPAQPKAPPFTPVEVALLSEQALQYKDIIENKTSDAVMWKEKQDTWEIVSQEFRKNGFTRSGEQLLNKWNALKKKARSEFAKERRVYTKTGGGTVEETQIVSSISEKVSGICSAYSIHGGSNMADSDSDAFRRVANENEPPEEDVDMPAEMPEQFTYEINLTEEEGNIFGFSSSSSDPQPSQSYSSRASDERSPSASKDKAGNAVQPTNDWSNYSPAMLRTPRSNALKISNQNVANGKKVTPKYKNNKRIYATHERLLLEKEELVDYQKKYFRRLTEIAEQEELRNIEEHTLKMQFLRDQEERAIAFHHEKMAAVRKCCSNNCCT